MCVYGMYRMCAVSPTLSYGDISAVGCDQDHLWVALLQVKELVFAGFGAPPRPQGACRPHRRQILPLAVFERQLPTLELQRVRRGPPTLCHQLPIVGQEAAVAGLQAVLAVQVDQGQECSHPPGDVHVHGDLSVLRREVGVALAGDGQQVGLWVQGQVHGPQLSVRDGLGEAGQVVPGAAEEAQVLLRLQGPAAVRLGHDDEAALAVVAVGLAADPAILVRGQVASQVTAQVGHLGVLGVLLQGPDLFLLHTWR